MGDNGSFKLVITATVNTKANEQRQIQGAKNKNVAKYGFRWGALNKVFRCNRNFVTKAE